MNTFSMLDRSQTWLDYRLHTDIFHTKNRFIMSPINEFSVERRRTSSTQIIWRILHKIRRNHPQSLNLLFKTEMNRIGINTIARIIRINPILRSATPYRLVSRNTLWPFNFEPFDRYFSSNRTMLVVLNKHKCRHMQLGLLVVSLYFWEVGFSVTWQNMWSKFSRSYSQHYL